MFKRYNTVDETDLADAARRLDERDMSRNDLSSTIAAQNQGIAKTGLKAEVSRNQ